MSSRCGALRPRPRWTMSGLLRTRHHMTPGGSHETRHRPAVRRDSPARRRPRHDGTGGLRRDQPRKPASSRVPTWSRPDPHQPQPAAPRSTSTAPATRATPWRPALPAPSCTAAPRRAPSYGNLVIVRHADGTATYYVHLSRVQREPSTRASARARWSATSAALASPTPPEGSAPTCTTSSAPWSAGQRCRSSSTASRPLYYGTKSLHQQQQVGGSPNPYTAQELVRAAATR